MRTCKVYPDVQSERLAGWPKRVKSGCLHKEVFNLKFSYGDNTAIYVSDLDSEESYCLRGRDNESWTIVLNDNDD